MKKLYYLLVLPLALIGCQNDQNALPSPSNVSGVHAKPDTGAVIVYMNIPNDGNLLYVKVSTKKYPNNPDSNQVISTKASVYADSAVIKGLLHKYKYVFTVQPFTANPHNEKGGKILETKKIRPIRRPIKTVYHHSSLTQVKIKPSMITAKTVDFKDDNATYLLDGDLITYWQSAWYYHPHKPPFYIYINFSKKVSVGAMKYANSSDGNSVGFANQFGIAISKDGENWNQVWESSDGLPDKADKLNSLYFDKNYTSKHFRLAILSTSGGGTFAQFSELKLYKMKRTKTDLEKKAEKNYADHFYKNW